MLETVPRQLYKGVATRIDHPHGGMKLAPPCPMCVANLGEQLRKDQSLLTLELVMGGS